MFLKLMLFFWVERKRGKKNTLGNSCRKFEHYVERNLRDYGLSLLGYLSELYFPISYKTLNRTVILRMALAFTKKEPMTSMLFGA